MPETVETVDGNGSTAAPVRRGANQERWELPVNDEPEYRPQFAVLVEVGTEQEQIEAYTNLRALGYTKLRVLSI